MQVMMPALALSGSIVVLAMAVVLKSVLFAVFERRLTRPAAAWRLFSRPEGTVFFASVLRANLYVLLLVIAVPAVLILPKRLKSPDFIAKRHHTMVNQTTDLSRGGADSQRTSASGSPDINPR